MPSLGIGLEQWAQTVFPSRGRAGSESDSIYPIEKDRHELARDWRKNPGAPIVTPGPILWVESVL
jgi:hypothetical protein